MTPGDQAIDGVDEDERRDLARGEHVVAYGDLVRHVAVYHALVHAFVAAADQDELLFAAKSAAMA